MIISANFRKLLKGFLLYIYPYPQAIDKDEDIDHEKADSCIVEYRKNIGDKYFSGWRIS
jgi:hypothetical protein